MVRVAVTAAQTVVERQGVGGRVPRADVSRHGGRVYRLERRLEGSGSDAAGRTLGCTLPGHPDGEC